jgi:8-oxo-dGTP pyrophosphatase MutT (NUDIX family)
MLPITYTEHGIIINIKETTPTRKRLKNMRDGKPYIANGRLLVCFDSQVHEVTEAEYFDDNKNPITFEQLNIDTNVRVGGVIIYKGKVLLFHRIKNGHEYYVFPGGHKLAKETPGEALVREIMEETGLNISGKPLEQIYTSKNDEFGEEVYFRISGIEDFTNLKKINPDVREGEVNESVWIPVEDLQKMENVFPKDVVDTLNRKRWGILNAE